MTAPKTLEEKAREWLMGRPNHWEEMGDDQDAEVADLAALLASEQGALLEEALRVVMEKREAVRHICGSNDTRVSCCDEIRARLEALRP
jgi:hypothetical protein